MDDHRQRPCRTPVATLDREHQVVAGAEFALGLGPRRQGPRDSLGQLARDGRFTPRAQDLARRIGDRHRRHDGQVVMDLGQGRVQAMEMLDGFAEPDRPLDAQRPVVPDDPRRRRTRFELHVAQGAQS
ncbi:hypothetical protein RZS08_09695, partial [Arthrospira platensis SPKY1]|nr:hypothetical protein [Arthrospira platensis SPKY1]